MKRLRLLILSLGLPLTATNLPAPTFAQEHHHESATSVAPCEAIASRRSAGCSVEEYLLSRLEHHGVESAMAALDSLAAGNEDIRREAHSYAHAIGLKAFTDPATVGEVFGRCTPAYQSGCYHGVIQAYFIDHSSTHGDHLDGAMVDALCEGQRDGVGNRWRLFQCAHGMGHGLLMLADHHLPTALEWCDLVADAWERESCYGGAFMENIVAATAPHHSPGMADQSGAAASAGGHEHHGGATVATSDRPEFPPLKREDPFYPCTAVDDRYLAACYQMQTSAVLHFNRQDLAATARLCGTIPGTFQPTCFQSLGRDISSITLQDHERAMRLCAVAPAEYEPWCHIGYAKNLVDVTAEPNDGFDYCRLLPVGESKRVCYVAVGEEIWVLSDSLDGRGEMCLAAEPEYVDACRHGAGIGASEVSDTALRRLNRFRQG
jgi:hypothetical protein